MIKYRQNYNKYGTGLGYQLSIYALMKSLSRMKGFEYCIGSGDLLALRNTFSNLDLKIDDSAKELTQLNLYHVNGFDDVVRFLDDDCQLSLNLKSTIFKDNNHFYDIVGELEFRDEIYQKCKDFLSKFKESSFIAMHVPNRNNNSSRFESNEDYYEYALEELPKDVKVLLFTNDKDHHLNDPYFLFDDRFELVVDIFNDNEYINCDVGQELDRMIDTDPTCRYNYKSALIKIASDNLASNNIVINTKSVKMKVDELIKELHPKYVDKVKNNLYNYSFDLCLMSMCDYHIMSTSYYSMWATILANSKKVVYPKYWKQTNIRKIARDLEGFDQTRIEESRVIDKETYIGVDNPDRRSFIITKNHVSKK